MPTSQQVDDKVREYLAGDYEIRDTQGIPTVDNVPFGNVAIRTKLCAWSIDLRNSTGLLESKQRQTAGKVHKSFLYVAASMVNHYGGYLRSFKGDALLAFWPANTKTSLTQATRAALATKYLLSMKLAPRFAEYGEIDYGIGLDWGNVYVLRVGVPRDPNDNDLVFIGPCVNFAVAVSEQAKGPNHVEIDPSVYTNLEDGIRTDRQGNDIWRDGKVVWRGKEYPSKITNGWVEHG